MPSVDMIAVYVGILIVGERPRIAFGALFTIHVAIDFFSASQVPCIKLRVAVSYASKWVEFLISKLADTAESIWSVVQRYLGII